MCYADKTCLRCTKRIALHEYWACFSRSVPVVFELVLMHGNSHYVNNVVGRLQRRLCETYGTWDCRSPKAVRSPASECTASQPVVQESSRGLRDIAQELGLPPAAGLLKCPRISLIHTTVRGTHICCPTIVHLTPYTSKFEALVLWLFDT